MTLEIEVAKNDVRGALMHLREWAKPEKVRTSQRGARSPPPQRILLPLHETKETPNVVGNPDRDTRP